MQTSLLKSHTSMRGAYVVLVFGMAAGVSPATGEDIPVRLERAVDVLNKLTDAAGRGINPEEIASADCVAYLSGPESAAQS